MKRILQLLAVLAAMIVAAVGFAAPAAQAATVNPITPTALCGIGYTVAKQERVVASGDPIPAAQFSLLYNRSINTFCAVTIKRLFVGVPTETSVSLYGAADTILTNSGPRLFAAGPVFDRPFNNELGRCVLYGASLTAPDGKMYFHETANPAIGFSLYCLP